MKEATGDLSMTAVAIVAIAAVALMFSTLIWPSIKVNILNSTRCAGAHYCEVAGSGAKSRKCWYINDKGEEKDVLCPIADGTSSGGSVQTGGVPPSDGRVDDNLHLR